MPPKKVQTVLIGVEGRQIKFALYLVGNNEHNYVAK